jgi:hypothetical protein
LIPTVGTGLLILCAAKQTFVYKLLSLKFIVGIGLISYSAYLWHQPIFAFARHRLLGDVSDLILITLCLTSLVMGWLSWKFVEAPFRSRLIFSRNFVFRFTIVGFSIFSLIGIYAHLSNGFVNRLSDEEQEIFAFESYSMKTQIREGVCFLEPDQNADYFREECLNGKNLIWGDSHAAMLSFGLRMIDDFSQLTASACPPLIYEQFSERPNCLDINNKVLSYIEKGSFKKIYLHSNWLKHDISKVSSLLTTIEKIVVIDPSLQIKVIGGVPQWSPSLPKILGQRILSLNNLAGYEMKNDDFIMVEARDNEIIELLRTHKNRDNIEFISLLDVLCDDEECVSVVADCEKAEPITYDYGHLTVAGSKVVARFILNEGDLVSSQCSDEL